ncbi:MAG: D-alanine--D-alanine ligase [Firmicutes bacterium HGW-Firmicutes-9]|jgi:D-alanine-D-alanine ligase|nr:MAG: D-alanine--D-alanine ligase [Firmicutes bacterium HGW-Firmicutes-9]
MNIVVLAGGLSPERDVSLSTGTMVTNALRKQGHNAILIDLFFGMDPLPNPIAQAFAVDGFLPPFSVPEAEPNLAQVRSARTGGFSEQIGSGVLELCRAADLTFLALHGGVGENGSLQSFFDLCDIPYTGSPSIGCALAMDKAVSKSLLRSEGILTADWAVARKGVPFDSEHFPIPCVVKPNSGGSSIGVVIVRNREELAPAIQACFALEDELIVEAYIKGMELSAGVLGSGDDCVALPLIEIVPKHGFYDYQHKYQSGWTDEIVPARISPELTEKIQELAKRSFRALKLGVYARIDFLLTDAGEAYCLEANTLPGMTPTSLLPQEAEHYGLDYPALCETIVKLSLKRYEQA